MGRATKPITILALLLAMWVAPMTRGQDSPTAEQMLQQGLSLYNQGDYTQAQEVLQRIDPLQLTKEQRVTLHTTLQNAARQSEQLTTPAGILEQAAQAQTQGEMDRAVSLYQTVQRHAEATDAQKQEAAARLAEIRRRSESQLSQVKMRISEAEADVKAGRLDAATTKLEQVRASGVDLGWFDSERVKRLDEVIAERQAALPVAEEVASEEEVAAETPAQEPATQEVAAEQPATQPAPAAPAPVAVAAAPAAGTDVLAQAKRLYAQQAATQGRQAEEAGQYRLAVQHYTNALELDPDNVELQNALTAAQAKANQQEVPRGVLEGEVFSINLRTAATEAEFRELMNRAQEQAASRNFTAAQETVQQAKIVLDRNKRFLPTTLYRSLRDESVNLAANIADQANRAQEQAQADIETRRQADAELRRQTAILEQQVEIQRLLRRAVDLRREQKYDQALELLNQALFLDPNNIPAEALKEMIEDSRLYVRNRQLERKKALLRAEISVENQEAMLPYSELINYPSEWPQITALRLGNLEQTTPESELNRRIAQKLKEPVPINFESNRLVNVIEYLRNTTGLNFYVNWNKLRDEAGVEQDTLIHLQLTNVPADHALELVLQQSAIDDINPIGYSIIRGIVTISTRRDLNRSTEFRTYDIRDLLVQVPNFSNAPEFSLSSALSNTSSGAGGGGTGGGGGGGGLFGDDDEEDDEDDPLSRPRSEVIEEILGLIRDTVGRQDEWDIYGGDVSSAKELNGNLIIKTTPANHRDIVQLLNQLRETRAMQISVEARFLAVESNYLEEIGLDLDVSIDDVGGNFGPISIAQDSFAMAARPGNPLSPFSAIGGNAIGAFVPGTGFPSSGRSLDLGATYLDDLQVNLLLRATQATRRAINLTAPRITFFNGQRSYVAVATEISFISDLVPIPDAVGFDPTLSIAQSGVALDVEGTISADRRYVTMTLQPTLANIRRIRQIPITAVFDIGGDDDSGDDGEQQTITANIEAPELEISTLATTVSVPDKGTLLIGGQRLVQETEIEAGVPILSKVPIINRLFTNRSSQKDERTLLILVRPTIIIQSEVENRLFPGLLEGPTQFQAPGAE